MPGVTVELHPYDPDWPRRYEQEAARVIDALGERVRLLAHVGSTSVPGLAAKPTIDIVLAVEDSSDESAYGPGLEGLGYSLRIREPDWLEHRMFRGPADDINLHVFTFGASEIDRMIRFRDRLRISEAARRRYEDEKRELAGLEWDSTQDYANAKTGVIEEILACS